MPEIPEIGVGRVYVPEIPTWRGIPPQSIPQEPPVTLMLGFPVADIPAYDAMDFTPGTLTYGPAKPPAIEAPKEKPAASKQPVRSPSPSASLSPGIPKVDTELPCPPPDAIPIGAKNKLQTAVVTGYKRVDGECKVQLDPLDVPKIIGNYLPGAPVITTTATIAAVATTAAIFAKPLGDILLKVIKPIVKKTIKKIKEKLGKKVVVESAWQRRKFQRSLKK